MKNDGAFWTNKLNKKEVASILERIDEMSSIKWNKIVNKYNYLYSSDKGNKNLEKF